MLVEKYGWGSQAMKSNIYQFVWQYLNGEISLEELKEVFRKEDGYDSKEDEKHLTELIKSIDTDLNGQISFEEFYNMMLKLIDGLI